MELARLAAASLLLITAFALGGSTAGHPGRAVILQLVSVAAALTVLLDPKLGKGRLGLLEITILSGLIALPIIHLIPLSFSTWSALPGRALAADILRLSGHGGTERPLTFEPQQTISAGLALLPGISAFVVGCYLRQRDRLIVAGIVLFGALVSLTLGALQFASGTSAAQLSPFQSSHVGQPLGLFANVNHQASLMLIAVVFAGSFAAALADARVQSRGALLLSYGLAATFAIATILAGSRMGLLLLPVAVIAILLQRGRLFRFSGFAMIVALAAASILALMHRTALFASKDSPLLTWQDARYGYWQDVIYGIQQFTWAGSGLGTFASTFPTIESLEVVSGSYLNHAHNEYLEILFETGFLGALLLMLFLVLLIKTATRLFHARGAGDADPIAYAGFTCVLLLLGHSLVDYPIRMGLIMTIFGFCCAAMLGPVHTPGEQPSEDGAPEPL